MIMCVLLCYPVSMHMSQLLSTGRPITYKKIISRVQWQCAIMDTYSLDLACQHV